MKTIYERANFINDMDKMDDFLALTKSEFLSCYSYLTEEEYDNTRRIYNDMHNKNTFHMDDDKMLDSMCYDSGTIICSYGTEEEYVQVVVRGYVKVFYKDGVYKYFTNMPEELQQLFLRGDYEKIAQETDIAENNWHDVEYIKDGVYMDGTLLDLGTPATKEELEKACKELFEFYTTEEE